MVAVQDFNVSRINEDIISRVYRLLIFRDPMLAWTDPCMTFSRLSASVSKPVDCEVEPHEFSEERVLVSNHFAEVGRPVLGRVRGARNSSLPEYRSMKISDFPKQYRQNS